MAFFLTLLIAPLIATPTSEKLASKVIELRKEVELLNNEYKTEREKVLNELKTLSIQKAELASNIRNEEIRKKQLDDKLEQLKKDMGETNVISEELRPIVSQRLAELKTYVEGSLPFKKKERLQSITELEKKLERKEISAIKAANQLWAMVEDENRLARETSLHKQSIPIGSQLQLAEVAKVGMSFLYFKAENGSLGMVKKENDQWVYKVFQSVDKQQQAMLFFESLKKNIRQGYFELPTTL